MAASNHEEGVNVLSVLSKTISPRLLWGMRTMGMVGPLFSGVMNGYSIYDATTNNKITEQQKTHQLVSGSLGVASSSLFLGGAFFITPASFPIAAAFICGGSGMLVAQTLYDEWGNLFPKEQKNGEDSKKQIVDWLSLFPRNTENEV